MTTTRLCILATLLLAPAAGLLGYEGGRVMEYQRAIRSAEHAAAALDGALAVCRTQHEARDLPAAERRIIDLTQG